MTVTEWLIIAVVVLPFVFAAWVKRVLRNPDRDPQPLVGTARRADLPATVVRPLDTYLAARIYLVVFGVLFALWGAQAWSSAPFGAVILWLLAAYFAGGALLFQTGRIGAGTIWLTPDGIYQSHHGFEQQVRWEDIRAVVPMVAGAGLQTDDKVAFRRRAPLIWVGRGPKLPTGTMDLQLGNIHTRLQNPLMEAILLWQGDEQARAEIGTDAAVRRILDGAGSGG